MLEQTDVTTIGYSAYQTPEMVMKLKDTPYKRVCVDPRYIEKARVFGFHVSTVIGFPFGYATDEMVRDAIFAGAHELDIPIPLELLSDRSKLGYIRPGMFTGSRFVGEWVSSLRLPFYPYDIKYKFILHTDLLEKLFGDDAITIAINLSDSLKSSLAPIYRDGRVIIKTCTGYGPGGASVEMVKTLSEKGYIVKASGGIRSMEDVTSMEKAGASLLGIGYSSFLGILDANGADYGA